MFPARNFSKRVVVIGGGLAGQTAAIEAVRHGAEHVVLLEKEKRMGGNSGKATSGINAWGSRAQREQHVEDGPVYFERDTYRSGRGGHSLPGLVRMLSAQSAGAISFLESFGVPLSVLSQLGGASRKRCHRAPDKPDGTPMPIGYTIVSTLEKYIRSEYAGKVDIVTGAALTRILSQSVELGNGQRATVVTGVEYQRAPPAEEAAGGEGAGAGAALESLDADAVILATGGFSNDHTSNSLLQKFAPHLAGFPTTNGVWATGDGVKAAEALGVALVDMDKVQLHPTGLLNPKDPKGKTVFLGPEALRGSGGILLNQRGERFVNELDLRSVVSAAIIAQDDVYPGSDGRRVAYCVLNEAAAKAFGPATLGFYWKKMGLFQHADDVAGLAGLLGCNETTLRATLESYQRLSERQTRCPETGKSVYPCVLGTEGPYYVAVVTPSIHYTMGGCLINSMAQVLSDSVSPLDGSRLPLYGLFGAGEVTGGVHGGNRLGGNSLLECVVFGRIAGERAARVAAAVEEPTALRDDTWQPLVVAEALAEPGDVPRGDGEGDNEGDRLARRSGLRLVLGLPSCYQTSGLALLQPLLLRSAVGGQQRTVQLTPASAPSHPGSVALYLPPLDAAPAAARWVYDLQPGMTVEVKKAPAAAQAAPALAEGSELELFVIASAPQGVPVALQLALAAAEDPALVRGVTKVQLLYEAPSSTELSYAALLRACARPGSDAPLVQCHMVAQRPSGAWEGDVGSIDEEILRAHFPGAAVSEKERQRAAALRVVVAGNATWTGPIVDYLARSGYGSVEEVRL